MSLGSVVVKASGGEFGDHCVPGCAVVVGTIVGSGTGVAVSADCCSGILGEGTEVVYVNLLAIFEAIGRVELYALRVV